MLEGGWVDEVRQLFADGLGEARAMRSVGYRQIAEALASGNDQPSPASLREPIYRATRVFARRQRTWLRDEPVEWLDPQAATAADLASRLR
jgi:tRNA dimethylallyltransferase